MYGSGRETLSNVREWSGVNPGCPGVVGKPSQMSGSGRKVCQMSGRGRKAISNVREWSGDHAECLGMVGRPSRMSGSGQEAFPIVWK